MQPLRGLALVALLLASSAHADPSNKPESKTEKAGHAADKAADKGENAAGKASASAGKAKDSAGKEVGKEVGKGADSAGTAADQAAKEAGKAADKAEHAKAEAKTDREALKKKSREQKDELIGKMQKALHGKPMHAALREELQRHARRLARLDRVATVANDAKDEDALGRVKKLIDKENARHDKWMANFDSEKGGTK